jgi:hypothetical protein
MSDGMKVELPAKSSATGSWTQKYGDRHRFQRVSDFPAGIVPPRRVRIYRRSGHHLLQWWDPAARQNLAERIDGDLVAAIVRARQIEERLVHFRTSGQKHTRRLVHGDLIDQYVADLRRRADAGEIGPATVERYHDALQHYRTFCEQPEVGRAWPHAAGVNREFRLALSSFLNTRVVSPNGRTTATKRPMRGHGFVLDTVRAMFEWAADADRGALLPEGFRNPFLRRGERRALLQVDPLAEPDITLPMALDMVKVCDGYQLRLFVPMLLFGLRAAEPCMLFREFLDGGWLRVPCLVGLNYLTKGRRDKRFRLLEDLQDFWDLLRGVRTHGLLYLRRAVEEFREQAPLRERSLEEITAEYRRRCGASKTADAATRQRLREEVISQAGGLRYDDIEQEFQSLARQLNWPSQATLKDMRHLFATAMTNASLPEAYRRYLMGQSPGKAAIGAYTHLNELRRHFAEAVRREWQPLLDAVRERLRAVRVSGHPREFAAGRVAAAARR